MWDWFPGWRVWYNTSLLSIVSCGRWCRYGLEHTAHVLRLLVVQVENDHTLSATRPKLPHVCTTKYPLRYLGTSPTKPTHVPLKV